MTCGKFPSRCIDIVICIDASESMKPWIDCLKANVNSIFRTLYDEAEGWGMTIARLRVRLVQFRDYAYDAEPMVESEFFTLPDEAEEFLACLNAVEAKGGGDRPENALEALACALSSDWTEDGDRRRHLVVMMTDADAHPLGEYASKPFYPEDMPIDIKEIYNFWHLGDGESSYQPRAGRLVAITPETDPWIELMGWDRVYQMFIGDSDAPDLETLTALIAWSALR